jgi:hypothetical protein
MMSFGSLRETTLIIVKEPLAKQAAQVYNQSRKVYRTRSSDMPSVKMFHKEIASTL